MQARVDEGDAPVGDVARVQLEPAAAFGEREVVRQALVVVEEILPDHVAAVAQAQDEVLVAEVRVVAHEVPDDRPYADVDERLRQGVRMLAQARAESAAEEYDLHD